MHPDGWNNIKACLFRKSSLESARFQIIWQIHCVNNPLHHQQLISHSGFDTRSVLIFCALRTTNASNLMMNAGFYFESARFLMVGFHLSQSYLLFASHHRLISRPKRSKGCLSCSFSHCSHLCCFASPLCAVPMTLTVLCHISKSLSSPTLFNGHHSLIVTENRKYNNYLYLYK